MEGAVLFGLNPNKIVQRKARYAIGLIQMIIGMKNFILKMVKNIIVK